MKNRKTLPLLLLLFVLLLGGAYLLYTRLSTSAAPDQLVTQPSQAPAQSADPEDAAPEESEPEKISAPDFTVYDAEENEVCLSDYTGKPIILNFWASWCGPCQSEMPDFHEKYLELGEEIHFLMINATGGRETQESACDFIEENEYTFPVFFDTQADAVTTYGAYSLPTTYFIDAEGYVIARAIGAIDSATLQRGIDMILEQE